MVTEKVTQQFLSGEKRANRLRKRPAKVSKVVLTLPLYFFVLVEISSSSVDYYATLHMPPAADEPADSAAHTDDEDVILLAEDDMDLQTTYQRWLADAPQWDVKVATDGDEALEKLDDNIDVLVLDRRMPGLSGPELMDQLGTTDFDGDVVAVSAFGPDQHLDAEDVEAYLSKPIKKAPFLETLEEVVST